MPPNYEHWRFVSVDLEAIYRLSPSGQRAVVAELWTGADVVWTGPDLTEGEHRMSRGDRAVVVDAGRHHVRSFSVLGRGLRRARKGVVIRIGDEVDIEVDPRHLEVIAPDHPLRPESDGSAAAWWLDQLEPYDLPLTIASFVPRSFGSVARVLHRWRDSQGEPARWAQVADELDVESVADSGIWWPADRSWFVHTEVDFPWTFVTGDTDLARAVHQHPRVEAQATRHEASANTLPG